MTYWQDKVVVITGGSSGFGYSLANMASRQLARVVLVARDEERLARAASELDSARVTTISADVTDPSQVHDLFRQVDHRLGAVDALVNCVGKSSRGKVMETSAEDFQQLWEVNFLTAVHCTRAAMPHLLTSRGHVVHVGSLAAKVASRFLGAYPASKFPLAAYSQQLRLELASEGVHVLLVCPGPIARPDAGRRYAHADVPASARRPGGGVKLRGIDPERLARQVLAACERRKRELIVPGKAKLLFAVAQLSPRLGDWLVDRMTRS